MDILRYAVRDSAPEVRANALSALGGFGALAKPAREEVIASLRDAHHNVRLEAMVAVVRLQLRAPRAIQGLRTFFSDRHPAEQLEILDRLIRGQAGFGAKIPGLAQLSRAPERRDP